LPMPIGKVSEREPSEMRFDPRGSRIEPQSEVRSERTDVRGSICLVSKGRHDMSRSGRERWVLPMLIGISPLVLLVRLYLFRERESF
jgi:hypothetical protein